MPVRRAVSLLLTLLCAAAAACTASRANTGVADVTTVRQSESALSTLMSDNDRQRLVVLAAERAAQPAEQGTENGYRIGPDDLLDIRIPDLLSTGSAAAVVPAALAGTAGWVAAAPVFQQGLRVSATGDVNLPVLGVVRAKGRTARELEAEIARRLVATGILRKPQVSVLVAEYRSRVVAVIGSVEHPGLYPVTRPGATIADLIWAAGGPSKDAGRLVQFSPAHDDASASSSPPSPGSTADGRDATMVAEASSRAGVVLSDAPSGTIETARGDSASNEQAPDGEASNDPIRIDLAVLLPAAGRNASTLNPQVRQGDVISLAPAGNVQVDGWVERPGSYPLTRNLTLSGAIAAAGGTNFATDRTCVTVKRAINPGQERSFTVDVAAVSEGRAVDVPIIDGDVVYVPASSARVVPWGVWNFITTIFRVGASVVAF